MPNQLPAHDAKNRKRFNKINTVLPKNLAMARKYRSSSNWQKVVAIQKAAFPMCYDPHGDHKDEGTTEPMAQVHHIRGLAIHFHLRAYSKNLASLCVKCHDKIEKMERKGQRTWYLFKKPPVC